jgi:hypothetical protein
MRTIVLEKIWWPLVIKEIPEPEPMAGHVVMRSERLAAGEME